MDIKTAKKLFNEMLDICAQIGDPTLDEASEGIYRDVQSAKTIECVISFSRELMVFVSEVSDDDEIADFKTEIEDIHNELLESFEDL